MSISMRVGSEAYVTVLEAFYESYNAKVNAPAKPKRPSVVAAVLAMVLGVVAGHTVRAWQSFRRVALCVAALGMLTGAAFTLGLGWGLAAGGLSLLVLEWRVSE